MGRLATAAAGAAPRYNWATARMAKQRAGNTKRHGD